MRFIAFDYSLSCPACCVIENDNIDFLQTKIYYITSVKKQIGKIYNLTGFPQKSFKSFSERYENIANQFIEVINPVSSDIVYLEDYSLGSKGLIFSIAENTGILKYLFYKQGININLVSPGAIKKSFAGKGTSDKKAMYEEFNKRTGINLYQWFGIEKFPLNIGSPYSDIVDAWALGLYGYANRKKD
jgi:Holliday junction resolvasome RuvABC endonuclease subunit